MAILIKYITAAACLLMLTGCYEVFTPELPDSKPRLCINSLITAGETVEATVSHTWLYTDTAAWRDHSVDDARLTLYVGGVEVSPGYVASEGDMMRIVAESPTYGRAEAEVEVPRAVVPLTVEWTPRLTDLWLSVNDGWGMNASVTFDVDIDITLADQPDKDDYFLFDFDGFSRYPRGRLYTGELQYDAEPIFSEHIGVLESVAGSDVSGFTFFTDRQFRDGTYTLHIRLKNLCFEAYDPDYDEYLHAGLVLKLWSVSESYYNWANYVWQRDDGFVGDLSSVGLADPVCGYSNVSTSAGVVAAQSLSTVIINFHDFLRQTIDTAKE